MSDENDNTPSWMIQDDDDSNDTFEAAINPTRRFKIQSTSTNRDVPCLTDESTGASLPEALGEILTRSQLTFGPGTIFQLDGADIGYGQIVQPGGLIIAIGNVKGAMGN